MNPSSYQTRRANVEDLLKLRQLWQQAQLPVADLEKHLTEFQVATASDGSVLGCIGLHLENRQGKIHSEVYRSLEIKTELRSPLLSRVESVARNHGLIRIWVQEEDPFWSSTGFQEADAEALKKLPKPFGDPGQRWFTLRLREEVSPAISVEHEFELFKQSQREMSEKTLRQARTLRVVAAFVAAVALVLAGLALWYLLRHLPALPKR